MSKINLQTIEEELGTEVLMADIENMYPDVVKKDLRRELKQGGWESRPVWDAEEGKAVRKWVKTDVIPIQQGKGTSVADLIHTMTLRGYSQEEIHAILALNETYTRSSLGFLKMPSEEEECIDMVNEMAKDIFSRDCGPNFRLTKPMKEYIKAGLLIHLIDTLYVALRDTPSRIYERAEAKRQKLGTSISAKDQMFSGLMSLRKKECQELLYVIDYYNQNFYKDLTGTRAGASPPLAPKPRPIFAADGSRIQYEYSESGKTKYDWSTGECRICPSQIEAY